MLVHGSRRIDDIRRELQTAKLASKALIVQNALELGDTDTSVHDRYFGSLAGTWNTWDDIEASPVNRGLELAPRWLSVFREIDKPAVLIHDIHGTPEKLQKYEQFAPIMGWPSGVGGWPEGTGWHDWRDRHNDRQYRKWPQIREHLEFAAFSGPARQVFGPEFPIYGYKEREDIQGELAYTPAVYWKDCPEGTRLMAYAKQMIRSIRHYLSLKRPVMVWLQPSEDDETAKFNHAVLRWCVRNGVDVTFWNHHTRSDAVFADSLAKIRGALR